MSNETHEDLTNLPPEGFYQLGKEDLRPVIEAEIHKRLESMTEDERLCLLAGLREIQRRRAEQ